MTKVRRIAAALVVLSVATAVVVVAQSDGGISVIWVLIAVAVALLAWLALLLRSACQERDALKRQIDETHWAQQHLLTATKAGTWSRNVRTNEVSISPEWKAMLGYADDEIPDTMDEFLSRLDPEDVERVKENSRRYVAERPDGPYEHQFRLRHRDGTYRWILSRAALTPDAQGELNWFKGIAIDITALKEVEQALRAAEQRYRTMVDEQLELVVRWTPDSRLTYVNETALRFLGGRLHNPIGSSFFELLGQEDQHHLAAWMHRRPPDAQSLTGVIEARLINAEGESIWTQWTNRPIVDDTGRIIEVQSVGRDITPRKRLEHNLSDRLKFEALLSELARGFLEAPPDEFTRLVDWAISAIGNYLEADRLGICEFTENMEFAELTHEHCAEGVASLREDSTYRGQRSIRSGRHELWRRFTHPDRLLLRSRGGDLANASAATAHSEQPARSILQVPLKTGNRLLGQLFHDSVRAERDWTDRDILQFEILASLLSAAIWRNRVERDIQFRANLDRLVARSSNSFLNCNLDAIEQVIESTLADLGEITAADRCYYFELSDNLRYARERLEWRRPGVPSNMHQMLALPTAPFQWMLDRLLSGEVVHIANADALPPEASNLRSQMKGSSTVSSVVAPIFVQGRLEGLIGLSSVTKAFDWPQDRLGLIGVVAQMIAAARERLHLAGSLQARREELIAASRLAVLGEMVAGIAHEVKQPLHAIRNFASAIGHAVDDGSPASLEQIQEWSARTQSLVDRTDAIIARFRTFSRQSHPSATSRRPVCVRTIIDDAMELVAGELNRHSVEVVRDVPDETVELHCDPVQITQVIVNLLINAIEAMQDQPRDQRRIHVALRHAGHELELSIEDNGAGVPDRDRERIFDPFYTSKDGGLGIGLAVSRRIVHEHQGAIECHPSAAGARFRLTFPLQGVNGHEV